MRAVWSFWSEPAAIERERTWLTPAHHLMSWALSLETARRHYPDTMLVTDDAGARLLVDGLGLEYARVSTELNALAGVDPRWWSLGKLYAQRMQDVPFVHVDADVYLWNAIPEEVASAPVFAQNPEYLRDHGEIYRPETLEEVLRPVGGWLPPEWEWFRRWEGEPRGACCGIVGGTDVAFLRWYAQQGIRLVRDPANQKGWRWLQDPRFESVLFEQYLLSACIEYHRRHPEAGFPGIEDRYLFPSTIEAHTPGVADALGYTHLIAGAKRERGLMDRLDARMRRDHPALHARCLALAARLSSN
jgi:hypothetical protein